MVKQLKNRYSDPTKNKRFMVGVDRSKMRLYDLDTEAQKTISDSGQDDDTALFDKTEFNIRRVEDYSSIKF